MSMQAAIYIVKIVTEPGEPSHIWGEYQTEEKAKEVLAEISDIRPDIEIAEILTIYARMTERHD